MDDPPLKVESCSYREQAESAALRFAAAIHSTRIYDLQDFTLRQAVIFGSNHVRLRRVRNYGVASRDVIIATRADDAGQTINCMGAHYPFRPTQFGGLVAAEISARAHV